MEKRRLGKMELALELIEDMKKDHIYDMVFGKLTIENTIIRLDSSNIGYVVSSPLLPVYVDEMPELTITVIKEVDESGDVPVFVISYTIQLNGEAIIKSEGINSAIS